METNSESALDFEGQRVVCAAVMLPQTTRPILGARHYDLLMRESIRDYAFFLDMDDGWNIPSANEGFIDQRGNFLSRQRAWRIAEANGQIVRRVGGDSKDGGTLYSENLY